MNKFFKSFGFWIVLIVALFAAYYFIGISDNAKNIDFSTLVSEINNGNVKSIEYSENIATVETKNNVTKKCYIPSLDMLYNHTGENLKKQVENGSLTISTPEPESFPWWLSMLPSIIIYVKRTGK